MTEPGAYGGKGWARPLSWLSSFSAFCPIALWMFTGSPVKQFALKSCLGCASGRRQTKTASSETTLVPSSLLQGHKAGVWVTDLWAEY